MKLLRAIACAATLVSMSALSPVWAADIPAAPVVQMPVKAPGYSWYGFYIGVHGGYGWGRNGINLTPDALYQPQFLVTGQPTTAASNPKGFIGGAHWGSNWQFDRIVLGTESDFSFSDIKASQPFNGALGALPFTATNVQQLKWFATSRVRGGVLVTDNVLLYATGGLASGRVESSATTNATVLGACLPGTCLAGSISKDKYGWVVGGGIEYGTGPWQFRAEYLHYDLGTVSYNLVDPALPLSAVGASLRVSGDIARGGISYRFNWTPLGLLFGSDHL
jgi:outer membrane immunogenic protein